ncbi:MAG: hypothetical protein KDA29_08730 [Phycisphaerales bacterium]|nr:hypothetical protein [Phycisphaerales bacterium]
MDSIKPWQIVLFLAAIAVLGFSIWKFGAGSGVESQMADSMMLVDVQTGQLFEADIRGQRGILIPAKNPDSQKVSLLPVFEEDGQWYLYERYRGVLNQLDVTHDAITRPDEPVSINGEAPIKFEN